MTYRRTVGISVQSFLLLFSFSLELLSTTHAKEPVLKRISYDVFFLRKEYWSEELRGVSRLP